MAQNRYDAIIIGAGHNGLVAAAYLAKNGVKVLVLERLDVVGGACTTDEIFPGFNGPMCAYGCGMLQGKVVEDLRLYDYGFEIARSFGGIRNAIHPFPDGTYLGGPEIKGPLDLADQIRQFSAHDARSYFSWASFLDQAAGILYPYFLTEPPTMAELMESVRGTRHEEVLEKMLTWSLMDLVDEHFEDDHVRTFVLGVSEVIATEPGSIFSAAYFRCGQFGKPQYRGIPRGSMGSVTRAMAESAKSLGAEIRLRAPVERVIVEDGVAKGVRLASGEEIRSFIVVSNADPKRTYLTLVDSDDLDQAFIRGIRNIKTRVTCVKFLAAMREAPDLSRYLGAGYDRNSVVSIDICPSVGYRMQSWDDARNGKPTSCPLMGIQIPSVADPALTPKGGHVMSNWVLYQPPRLKEGTWDDVKEDVGEQIIDIITEYAPNFRSSLVDWTVQTPLDLELRVGLTDGSIRHGDVIPQQMLTQRQSYRSPIENLYLCGAGTHPGGEVTGAPGHNAAHAILKDLERVVV